MFLLTSENKNTHEFETLMQVFSSGETSDRISISNWDVKEISFHLWFISVWMIWYFRSVWVWKVSAWEDYTHLAGYVKIVLPQQETERRTRNSYQRESSRRYIHTAAMATEHSKEFWWEIRRERKREGGRMTRKTICYLNCMSKQAWLFSTHTHTVIWTTAQKNIVASVASRRTLLPDAWERVISAGIINTNSFAMFSLSLREGEK